MNIKRLIVLGLCLALALSFSCLAVDYDAYYYQNEDGSYGHDTEAYEHDLAVEMVQAAGFDIDPEQYWTTLLDASELVYVYDYDAFKADYDSMVEALAPDPEPTPDPYPVEWPDEVIEDETSVTNPVDEGVLENDTPDTGLELGEDTTMVYTLNDMRSSAPDGGGLVDGLKAVIRSLFGTYQPNMSTAAITEIVDGETITTLVDVVADGAAGVDYEYLSGVLLFAILLFCMMKLLGGVLS